MAGFAAVLNRMSARVDQPEQSSSRSPARRSGAAATTVFGVCNNGRRCQMCRYLRKRATPRQNGAMNAAGWCSKPCASNWGYDALRPLQETAVYAGVAGRDALVVMPTGGGKSLCFQIPPLLHGGLTVVISPLIALMKDQVDGLKLLDYPAACLNSSMEMDDINATMRSMNDGTLRLLYIAPERVLSPGFLSKLAACNQRRGPHSFAIDEAHCISQWGHDFRPEYRRLAELREAFPRASFQAFTATATQRVREDIISQLGLREPEVLIGTFDRPNLTYRVIPKVDPIGQIEQIIRRHTDGATIVYAISRKYTEEIADELRRRGIEAAAYHAGLEPQSRRRVQEDFSQERVDVVVATVAFGMGIDRGQRALRDSRRASQEHRALSAGDGACGSRWTCQ
jgi:ATP-dependent DNA helicase RecQ